MQYDGVLLHMYSASAYTLRNTIDMLHTLGAKVHAAQITCFCLSCSCLQQQQQKQMLWQQQHQRQQQELFRGHATANSELSAGPAHFSQQNVERNLAGLDKGHLQMPQGDGL